MPPIDLDVIRAALVPQYDQTGRGSNEWHDNIEVRARLEWLPALMDEVERLRGDLRATQTALSEAIREADEEAAEHRARDVLTTAVVDAAREYRRSHNLGSQSCAECQALSAALDALLREGE